MKKYAEMTEEERMKLISTLSVRTWQDDDRVLKHPSATIRMLAGMGDEEYVLECLPYVEDWEANGERVTMLRIFKKMTELYGLDEKILAEDLRKLQN